jgi:hypothetical protein
LGDSSKASKILGWKPSVSFPVSWLFYVCLKLVYYLIFYSLV